MPNIYQGVMQCHPANSTTFQMMLFGYQSLVLLAAAASTGKLITNFDATGGLLNKPSEKILHAKWVFAPALLFTSMDDMSFTKDLYATIVFAEYVSTNHSGDNLYQFFRAVDDGCRLVSGGRKDPTTNQVIGGQSCCPRAMWTDCDGASQNGAILKETNAQVTNRVMYHNVLLQMLLFFDHVVATTDQEEKVEQVAASVISILEMLLPLFLHYCKSHVYLAIEYSWFNSASRDNPVRTFKLKGLDMIRHFAKDITEVPSMSGSITKLCSAIDILSRVEIPCRFTVSTQVMEG